MGGELFVFRQDAGTVSGQFWRKAALAAAKMKNGPSGGDIRRTGRLLVHGFREAVRPVWNGSVWRRRAWAGFVKILFWANREPGAIPGSKWVNAGENFHSGGSIAMIHRFLPPFLRKSSKIVMRGISRSRVYRDFPGRKPPAIGPNPD
jgi:hypothetical protein